MKASRRDLLSECNNTQEPLDSFQEGWCRRCINPECTRSLFGQSRFDVRVNTWEDRLFKNPPRMDSADPLFKIISGKKFLSIDTSQPPEIRSWVDPDQTSNVVPRQELKATKVVETPPPPPVPAPSIPEPPALNPVEVVEPKKVEPKTNSGTPEFLSMNTTFQGGRMLSGVRGSQTVPRDPWSAPEPAENIVPIGGRVKFKGSGV